MPPGRSRVLSFMSQWGGQIRSSASASPEPDSNDENKTPIKKLPPKVDTTSYQTQQLKHTLPASPRSPSTTSRARADSRAQTRPASMVQTYQPPQVDVAQDTPPELQPIFTFLNSHSNKLYQEGYFLKLHDLDSRGRPSQDRVWIECFAQLVGTVLSLWDAAALDRAGEDGEVVPTFINLSDASIRMIESLPMNGAQGGSLQNVLSVSTAANNRYLLHFNSLNSLTQWTAGIRLAMYEHATLQEAYTGSLIAGKGRYLNNIKQIMDRSKFAYEDWARVRFGAGTPWKRCWCVISPPDEKEYQKAQKVLKKSSTYTRAQMPKGDIKFYDTRKVTKKTKPIATITDAYAAYAIYPQSKPLIDQSTLVKLEGLVTTHTGQVTTTEGFVFVMPEVHPAVSGFEMMLQWLFPVYDTFALYGRPTRLIADTLDQRGLMFAMPRDRRYGYLDILDVSGLIHTKGSQNWSERQWRKEMKKLTSTRMTNQMDDSPRHSRQWAQRRSTASRASLPPSRTGVHFPDAGTHSSPGSRSASPAPISGPEGMGPPRRTDSAPSQAMHMNPHKRSASDAHGYRKYATETPSRLSREMSPYEDTDQPPEPPQHAGALGATFDQFHAVSSDERILSSERAQTASPYEQVAAQAAASPFLPPPEPVLSPPAFQHEPNSRPPTEPYQAPELRRAHSNVDAATLYQMQDAVRPTEAGIDVGAQEQPHDRDNFEMTLPYRDNVGLPADQSRDFVSSASDDNSGRPRDPRQRLSTIPASPYQGTDGEYFQSPEQAQMPQMDATMDAARLEQAQVRPELVHVHSSHSISRKPVPKTQPPMEAEEEYAMRHEQASQVRDTEPASLDSPVSAAGSFHDAVIDEEALERILNDSRTNTLASSRTPDYASVDSAPATKKEQKEWQRPGKLKTVGDASMLANHSHTGSGGRLDTYKQDLVEQAADTIQINFGPTYSYRPNSRPRTGEGLTPEDLDKRRSRSRSVDKLRQNSRSRLSGHFATPSPRENKQTSYFVNASPANESGLDESPNRRQSVAWTPGTPHGGPSPGPHHRRSMTPEEWVQHRANLAAQPHAAFRKSPVPSLGHHRIPSSSSIHQLRQSTTKTPPPLSRPVSGDWTQQGRTRTPPSRPNSRGAEAYLMGSTGGLATSQSRMSLSAQEQMQISRATGSPLIDIVTSGRNDDEVSPGLIGALAARQREKEASAQGIRSSMVQQAIAARQQQQFQMEVEAQARAQYDMQLREANAQQQMMMIRAQQAMAMNHQQMMPPVQQRNSWRPEHGRAQSMQQGYNTPQATAQTGGYGGQFVQQQGMNTMAQQPGYGGPYPQSGQQSQWQPPRR